jgi:hypothetical protein
MTNDILEQTIQIRKTNKIKIPDAIIAASAIIHNLTVVTRNLDDLKISKGWVSKTHGCGRKQVNPFTSSA